VSALLQRYGPLAVMIALALASFWTLRQLDVDFFRPDAATRHTPDLYMENFVSTAARVSIGVDRQCVCATRARASAESISSGPASPRST